jgi:hypothetical protein
MLGWRIRANGQNSLPPCGGGLGWGGKYNADKEFYPPHPNPPPQGGREQIQLPPPPGGREQIQLPPPQGEREQIQLPPHQGGGNKYNSLPHRGEGTNTTPSPTGGREQIQFPPPLWGREQIQFPPPLWGRAGVGGKYNADKEFYPPTLTLPHRGGGKSPPVLSP